MTTKALDELRRIKGLVDSLPGARAPRRTRRRFVEVAPGAWAATSSPPTRRVNPNPLAGLLKDTDLEGLQELRKLLGL